MTTKQEVIDWLKEGVPSDYVIIKEGLQHLENPTPPTRGMDLSLLAVVKVAYPNGAADIKGKNGLCRDLIKRLEEMP